MAGFLALCGAWAVGQAAGSPSAPASGAASPAAAAAAPAMVKQVGVIRKIDGPQLWLATDQGEEVAVKIAPNARLLRLAPGQTDLKNAAAIQLGDLQLGDRVLVRGRMDEAGTHLEAAAVLVMKQQDIAQRKQQEILDWQRRSVGGLVQQADDHAGTVTISVAGASTNGAAGAGTPAGSGSAWGIRSVVVHTTPKTTYKRYSPDSVKWEAAADSHFGEIHPGDQLRARGSRSEDGSQIEAEEIVSGSFRNIAGRIGAIDAAQGTLTVEDLATGKPVTVRITADSQMKKLPPQMAMSLAARLKAARGQDGAPETTGAASPAPSADNAAPSAGAAVPGGRARGGDLNQMLGRLPAATLGDLQKGEAVMIVSTQGSGGQSPAAITLLGGVEPILTANPGGKGSESLLSPWSLASAPGGDQP